MNICKIEGCNLPVKYNSQGLCNRHGIQMWRHGKIQKRTKSDPNDIIIKADGTAEVILRDKNCEEVGRAIIDAGDIELIKKHKWCLSDGRARTNNPKKCMHQILNPEWEYTDHKNGNDLDNRRSNLRQATHTQNMRNSPMDRRNKTGFKGVRVRSRRKDGVKIYQQTGAKYQARITVNHKEYHLGYFEDKIEAAKAYDDAAIKFFKEFARLNFPIDGGVSCLI